MGLYQDLFASAAPAPTRPSAAVILWRSQPELEVYWVRRSPKLRFMGGWHAFPGGGLARNDRELNFRSLPADWSVQQTTRPSPDPTVSVADPDLAPGILACAVRELFEETGILLTTTPAPLEWREQARARLLHEQAPFADLLAEKDLELTAADLVPAGRWRTPPFSPIRFDNRFFLLEWPLDRAMQPEILEGELDQGEWISPQAAVERWRQHEVMIAPPILHTMLCLQETKSVSNSVSSLRDPLAFSLGPIRRIEMRPGVIQLPLATPTLPPATHTNAYLLGREKSLIVDPGCSSNIEQGRLLEALAAAIELGFDFEAVCLTHFHSDHVGAASRLRVELDLPVWAHGESVERLQAMGIQVDRVLQDGDRLELEHEGHAFPVEIVHTPGHTRGHICLFLPTMNAALSGDLLSLLSTMVIEPPEGDMHDYLESLVRIRELEPSILFPGHGPLVSNPRKALDNTRAHRLQREQRVADVWRSGARSPREIVDLVYEQLAEPLKPLAARQVEAHLQRLHRLGKIGALPTSDR